VMALPSCTNRTSSRDTGPASPSGVPMWGLHWSYGRARNRHSSDTLVICSGMSRNLAVPSRGHWHLGSDRRYAWVTK
jgi:hypothetical protein